MSQSKDFTLQQLAQIALGGETLDTVNISLLHTIINFALKKLDCENEKVILYGREAENLDKILRGSSFEPLLFIDGKDIKTPMKEFEKIVQLEEQVGMLEYNLEKHLSKVISHAQDASQACEMKCEVEEQKDETISALLKNEFLANELKKSLSEPIICRMNKLNMKLKKISDGIEEFKKSTSETHKNMNKFDKFSEIFLSLHEEMNKYYTYFYNSMDEIQTNMDSKLNNCEMLDFKLYFRNIHDQLTKELEQVFKMAMKPRALISVVEPLNKQKKRSSTKLFEAKDAHKTVCDCDEFARMYEDEVLELGSTNSS